MRFSKTLPLLTVLSLLASPLRAQPDVNYHPCHIRIGVVSSLSPTEFDVPHWGGCFGYAAPEYEYTLLEPFYIHLILLTSYDISAYEVQCAGVPPSGFLVEWVPIPGSGWINIGTLFNHIAAFGFPRPNPSGITHLGSWRVVALEGSVDFDIQLRPSVPSSVQGASPAVVVDGELFRTDYTVPDSFTGCYHPTPPGEYPSYVARFHGATVATASTSLTRIKELFR